MTWKRYLRQHDDRHRHNGRKRNAFPISKGLLLPVLLTGMIVVALTELGWIKR